MRALKRCGLSAGLPLTGQNLCRDPLFILWRLFPWDQDHMNSWCRAEIQAIIHFAAQQNRRRFSRTFLDLNQAQFWVYEENKKCFYYHIASTLFYDPSLNFASLWWKTAAKVADVFSLNEGRILGIYRKQKLFIFQNILTLHL